ncbi:NAD-dependent epimerase/dehydratase family protein [Actinoplanes sp. TBRC 11911]|uniref:NAD-dependent epimerase/dehydratase family protein n=1 Tax=Actinoplanes sp. TBRC 11911 TaxID=2729386 RepID=UPI00145FA54E|nr:NAD-dependent epimerase/dehydratase family protein [Actinoplanes sp. TBRC 11911]NMO56974.1 NAD-dependent epimerase/dehydratase family protein [Actinoplanes sp. TBRC 11911]
MRVVIVGATGDAGAALLRRLWAEADLDLVGVARRIPEPVGIRRDVEWHAIDLVAEAAADRLADVFRGADAVVNMAWRVQPSHDARRLFRTNVLGSREIARAAVAAGVGSLVQASSVGVYSPGPKDGFVTERYPRRGVLRSSYSRHRALVERMLDQVGSDYPGLRVVRVRPALIFDRTAGARIGRTFAGRLLRHRRIPLVPAHRRLRLQAVHADDVSEAYARILRTDVRGAFNLAADPVLDSRVFGEFFHGVRVPLPAPALVGAAALSWWSRLQPIDAGWVHLALEAPLVATDRAATELGWNPRRDAVAALREMVAAVGEPRSEDPDRSGGVRHRT